MSRMKRHNLWKPNVLTFTFTQAKFPVPRPVAWILHAWCSIKCLWLCFVINKPRCILNILICLMLTLKIIHNQHHSTPIQASTILHHAHPICRFFTLLLLLLITYVFSVAFVQFSRDTPLERDTFGSMGASVVGKSSLMGVNCMICPCFF